MLAVGIALRVIFFQGFVGSDPYAYSELADKLAHGKVYFDTYAGPVVFPLRFAFYGPVALFVRLFGVSEPALVAFPFIVSLAGCLLAYVLGRRIFGPTAGLIAAGLLCVLPIDVTMATTLFPDPVAAFWANLGIALLILDPDRNASRSLLYSALAGACFGISWLNKETVVYAAPFVLFCLLRRKAPLANVVCVGAVSALFLVGEAALFRATTGDWLFHFHMVQRNYVQNAPWFFDESSPYFGWKPGGYLHALIRRLFISGPRAELTAFCLTPTLALIAAVWGAVRRDARFVIVGAWLVSQMLLFNFGSSSLTSYRPLPLEYFERYLYPLLLPAVLLCAGALATLYRRVAESRPAKPRLALAAVVSLALATTIGLSLKNLRPRPLNMLRHVAQRVGPSDVVYTDYPTALFLTYFAQNKILGLDELADAKPITPYEQLQLADLRPGAYVLINDSQLDFVVDRIKPPVRYVPPAFYARRPASWKEISKEDGVTLFRIGDAPRQTAGSEPAAPAS